MSKLSYFSGSFIAAAMLLTLVSFDARAESLLRLPSYSEPTFQMMETNKLDGIVVITKEGCPVCTKQVPALESVLKKTEYKDLKVQQLNFQDPLSSSKFKATNQSTLIIYKDGVEVSRTVGVTDPMAIEAELKKAL